jgi:glycosyltransferase involved in cell wall biosynthesis
MAHGVEILYEAARRCPDPDVVFLVVGTGADRWRIEQLQAAKPLANLVLLEKASREEVRYLYALCDVNVVHLKAVPLFETVIPSKIFEAMVTRTPIALGVRGEARAIVEEAGAGLYFEPENAEALVQVVLRLKNEPALHAAMAGSGYEHVCRAYDRSEIAHRYAALLEHVAFGTIRTHRRSEEMAGLEYRSWV